MYSPTLKLTDNLQINIKFADTFITITHSAKYLGLIIDSNLDYKQHINMLECKVERAIGTLYKLENTFPQTILKQLHFALIQGVPEYMTQFQNFIKNKQVKIQRKLKYFLKGYEMPFQFFSLLQVVLKIVSLKWRPPMSMQF